MASSNLVITGGAGFIGSHLAESLAQNHKITIIDNMSTGKRKNLSSIPTKNIVLKPIDLSKVSGSHLRCADAVFHLAARSDVKESMLHPEIYFKDNVSATARLLDSMRKADVPKIVFVSSSVVYGQSRHSHKENSKTQPISTYGITKRVCESMIDSYCTTYGFKGVVLRLANIVGPRAPKGIIHDMVSKFQKDPKKILVLGDGNQTKSYLYVSDCINAITMTYDTMSRQSSPCEIYNVSNFDFASVNQVVRYIAETMNLKKYVTKYQRYNKTGAGWQGDIIISKMDTTKIKKIGWRPEYNCHDAIKLTTNHIIQ